MTPILVVLLHVSPCQSQIHYRGHLIAPYRIAVLPVTRQGSKMPSAFQQQHGVVGRCRWP
jgi:hypothetical protein